MASTDAVVKAMIRTGTRPDPRQIAESIWLASILPRASSAGVSSGLEPAVADFSTTGPEGGMAAAGRSTPTQPSSETQMTGFSEEWPEDEPPGTEAPGVHRMRRAAMRRQAWHSDANAIGRSLRPLRRTRIAGPDEFDLDHTIELMERTGGRIVRPVLAPGRRSWFDSAVLITDTGPSAPVWAETSRRVAQTLRNSRAFRNVYRVRVALSDGESTCPNIPLSLSAVPDERKLIMVLSDFAAEQWYGAQAWRWVVDLAQRSPLLLLTPLSSRLWSRTGLCAPTARVMPSIQGATSRLLSDATGTATAVPVATLTARSLGRWASSLMGRSGLPMDVLQIRPTDFDDTGTDEPPTDAERLESFLTMASPTAHRLAVMISPWRHISLELLSLLRTELVPEAEATDVAELVLSGIFELTATKNGSLVLSFREEARRGLEAEVTRTEIWDVYKVIDRVVSSEGRSGGGSLLLPGGPGALAGPEREAGFVPALVHLADVLGIEPRQVPTSGGFRAAGPSWRENQSGTPQPLRAVEIQSLVVAQASKRMNQVGGLMASTSLQSRRSLVQFVDGDSAVRVILKNPDFDRPGLTVELPHEMVRRLGETEDGFWAVDLVCLSLAGERLRMIDLMWTSGIRRIGNALPDPRSFLAPVDVLQLLRHRQIENTLLRSHGSVAITGPTGSGKTVQAQYWENRCYFHKPGPVGLIVLDLVDPHDGPASVIEALLLQPSCAWYLLVVEQIHANPESARDVFDLVDRLRIDAGMAISVLATSRTDIGEVIPPGFLVERTRPAAIFNRRLQDLDISLIQRERIEELCGNGQDLVLLGLVLDYMAAGHGSPPSDEQFIQHIGGALGLDRRCAGFIQHIGGALGLDRLVGRDLRAAMYYFACLGMYEIDIPASYAETMFGEEIVMLRDLGLIERADTSYRVPSVSLGAAMANYALTNWTDDPEWPVPHPSKLAAEYLSMTSDEQIKAALSRVGTGTGAASRRVTAAWAQRAEISRRLARYVVRDPEWGQNAASAAYAAVALAHLDMADHWLECAEFARESWDYGDGYELPRWRGTEPTREYEDFQRMQAAMRVEDGLPGALEAEWISADELDLERVHRIWMTAVLLWMEATAPPEHQDDRRRATLTSALDREVDVDGSYYPARIPWLTARVLTSLCEAGESQSEAAEMAARWLGRPLLEEQTRIDWASGTGNWNSDAMASAMCVIALAKQDEWGNREVLRNAFAGLDTRADIDESRGQGLSQTDKALMMEAFLLSSDMDLKEKAYGYLDSLLTWLRDGRNWHPDGFREKPLINAQADRSDDSASTRLAFVLCQVAGCIWLMAKDALLPIFEDVAADFGISRGQEPTTAAPRRTPQDSADPDPFGIGVAGPELVARAHDCLDRVERELVDNVAAREAALRTLRSQRARHRLQEHLGVLLGQRRACSLLMDRLTIEPVSLATIQDIEELGLEVLGDDAPRFNT